MGEEDEGLELQFEPEEPFYPMLSDIAGGDNLRQNLEDIVLSIDNQTVFQMLGVEPERSYLFEGPPGTGKTFGMRAIYNEIRDRGHDAKLHSYNIGTHGTAYINMGARILQNYFKQGKQMALEGKTVLYWFDEAEVLMSHRQGSSHKEDDKLLNTLMKNLQDINTSGDNQYIFFATNFKENMDKAALRSGRVDKVINFSLPTKNDIMEAYQIEVDRLDKHYTELYEGSEHVFISGIDYEVLAEKSEKFNYPDITEVVKRAVREIGFEVIKSNDYVFKLPGLDTQRFLRQIETVHNEKYKDQPGNVGFQ